MAGCSNKRTFAGHTRMSLADSHAFPGHTRVSLADSHAFAGHTRVSPADSHAFAGHTRVSPADSHAFAGHTGMSPADSHAFAGHTRMSPTGASCSWMRRRYARREFCVRMVTQDMDWTRTPSESERSANAEPISSKFRLITPTSEPRA
jgi:hypothetical protein